MVVWWCGGVLGWWWWGVGGHGLLLHVPATETATETARSEEGSVGAWVRRVKWWCGVWCGGGVVWWGGGGHGLPLHVTGKETATETTTDTDLHVVYFI